MAQKHKQNVTLEIFRYHADAPGGPWYDTYEVPCPEEWVVLDAINHIKDHIDGTLAYRWSCRMGVCGSCGMMINGEPRLACGAFLKEYPGQTIRVEPLANFPVQRDLAIDMDGFMQRLEAVQPYIVREDVDDTSQGVFPQTPAQVTRYKPYSMCINCMLCYAACPVMGLEPEFLGPAALAIGHRYNTDSRDHGKRQRLDAMTDHDGIWDCTAVGECSVVCPKNVDPAGAIQQAKIDAARQWYADLVLPKGAGR